MQARRAGRAVIVDVEDGDLGHAELIEDALATGRIAIAVACYSLINVVVVDLGVEEGFDASFEAEFGVVHFSPWFDEFGQTYAKDVGFGGWGPFTHCWGGKYHRRSYIEG